MSLRTLLHEEDSLKSYETSLVVVIAALGAAYSLFFIGFDFGTYLEYNFLYPDIYLYPEKYVGTSAELALAASAQRLFTLALISPLQTPWVSITLGVVLKAINFLTAFYLFSKVAELRHKWVFFGALILTSFSPLSDLVGEVEFTRGALSFTVIFSGIVLVLSGKVIIGYLFCAAAILIHPLDALSVFAFFAAGMLFVKYNQREWARHLIGVVPVLLVVVRIALEAPSAASLPSLEISDWYRLILALEGDDVTMFWHIRENWFVVSPILIGSFISVIGRPWDRIQRMLIGAMLLFGAVLIFEFLHYKGFSLGVFSEKFIALQFRRGLWFPVLLAVAVLAKYAERQELSPRDSYLLTGALLAALLFPKSLLAVCLVSIAVGYLFLFGGPNRWKIALIGVGWIGSSYFWAEDFGLRVDFSERQFAFLMLGLTFSFVWAYGVRCIGAGKTFVAASVLFVVLKMGNNLVVEQSLFLKGQVDRINQAVELEDPNDVLEWLLGRLDSPEMVLESAALSAIPKGAAALVAPIMNGYTAPIRANGSISFSRWDGLIVYSRSAAEEYRNRRDHLTDGAHPCQATVGSSTACILNFLADRIDLMTSQEILAYGKEYGLDHVVRRNELIGKEFKLIYQNRNYFVYKIDLQS